MGTNGLRRTAVIILSLCATQVSAQGNAGAAASDPKSVSGRWTCTSSPELLPQGDPSKGEVPLSGTAPGWQAFHLFTTDTWRLHGVGVEMLTDYHGSPQVVVMDEQGRCVILQSESGKWNARVVVEDGKTASAWANGDLDPRIEGNELYVGGSSGNVYRIVHRGAKGYETAIVAASPAASFSKFILGDLDLSRPGNEVIAFTNSGSVYEVLPAAEKDQEFALAPIGCLPARVRDAVLLPAVESRLPRIAAVIQTGEVALVTRTATGIDHRPLCKEPMSICRISRKPAAKGEAEVLYVARVDGLILRFSERSDGNWTREIIFAGPQGPRGLVAARFDADPRMETVAVFGYSKKVQLLSRRPGEPWRAETIYTDFGGGHWLAAGEIDGRNTTDEIVGGGFSYHVFMVSRLPGYGMSDIPTDADTEQAQKQESQAGVRRIKSTLNGSSGG